MAKARALAARWGVSPQQVLLAKGWVRPAAHCRQLAGEGNLPCIGQDALTLTFKKRPQPWRLLTRAIAIPFKSQPRAVAFNSHLLSPGIPRRLAHALGPQRRKVALMTRQILIDSIIKTYGARLQREAVWGLARRNADASARTATPLWQIASLAGLAGAFAGAAVFAFREAAVVLCAMFSLMFLLSIGIRIGAALHVTLRKPPQKKIPGIADADLPVYSILVPLFRERRILPHLASGLVRLDYPATKLDIKLIFEEADQETLAAAKALDLPGNIDFIIVPDCEPRTKPKALNFALHFATGDFAVIYDAEDRPEPDQLRKAVAAFSAAPPAVICLQARLNFFNAAENWLSKQFTIEYTSLFAGILPMLDARRLPIPLGGTSNHFRIEALRKLGAWDAFNVTEDADLGVRIYRHGYRCQMLDSTTWEEAACQPGNWLRQRTRWLKGWMQTYGVHMRRPRQLWRDLGPGGFLALHGLFAAILLSALAHPVCYLLLAYDALTGALFLEAESLVGQHFWALAIFNLAAGYIASLALGFAALRATGVRLAPQLIFIPFYWLLISAAAYRAVYQLMTAPYFWEKTEHGLSRKITRRKTRQARRQASL